MFLITSVGRRTEMILAVKGTCSRNLLSPAEFADCRGCGDDPPQASSIIVYNMIYLGVVQSV